MRTGHTPDGWVPAQLMRAGSMQTIHRAGLGKWDVWYVTAVRAKRERGGLRVVDGPAVGGRWMVYCRRGVAARSSDVAGHWCGHHSVAAVQP